MLYMNKNFLKTSIKYTKKSGKYDNQQQFKDILEADMVSSPEGFTNNSPIYPRTPSSFKKPSAKTSLCMFTNVLVVKKTAYCRVGAAKSKHKAIKFGNTPWALEKKRKGN